MSKKVLIIKCMKDVNQKELNATCENIAKNIMDYGVCLLPEYYSYEFGEIDGVVWEKQETEKKPEVDLDELIERVNDLMFTEDKDDDYPYNESYIRGYNNALCAARFMIRQMIKKGDDK